MLTNKIEQYSKNKVKNMYIYVFNSPLGKIVAAADENYLYVVSFEDSKKLDKTLEVLAKENNCSYTEDKNKVLKKFESELKQYFDGKIKKFSVPVKTNGSDFQKEVWNKLLEIPYGSTYTYGDLAKALDRPASHARAVGAACGANAHVLVIPCHRLVASSSKGGFSCGIDRKEWLLIHEKKFA